MNHEQTLEWVEALHISVLIGNRPGFSRQWRQYTSWGLPLFGSIARVDLRLPSVLNAKTVSGRYCKTFALDMGGVCRGGSVGLLMFCSNAVKYAGNIPFQVKLVLLVLAGVNMVLFHFWALRGVAEWAPAQRRAAQGWLEQPHCSSGCQSWSLVGGLAWIRFRHVCDMGMLGRQLGPAQRRRSA